MNLLIIDHLAVVIIFEHSFYIFDKWRYLHHQQGSVPSFYVALKQYLASVHADAVREAASAAAQAYEEAVATAAQAYEEAMATATHAYEEAVRTAVYPYQRNLPAWMAKLPFKPLKRKAKEAFERSQAKEREAFKYSQVKKRESLCSQAKAELIKIILEITLNHRLHMFHRHVVAALPLIHLSSARP
ncbi:uncharacterized protein F5147DRAFT_781641 [Suillus discolor]|uniref:Uncharacterized protein n=1 Tax=Suillus discolor TaxID=1912936 RepID=A0A9P7ERP8_9AGAM|nr:uncharacterized protein F5147DRAFT_781641 [Suillus discolor]KAG2086378.1 hypothetical protein F5147DRAFT_781641 [Suillus discolor]